jgi:hypothetical protein
MMSQSKSQSLIESCINVAIGFCVALAAQIAVFPLFGISIEMDSNVAISIIFTAISIARSYCVRRLFNRLHGASS